MFSNNDTIQTKLREVHLKWYIIITEKYDYGVTQREQNTIEMSMEDEKLAHEFLTWLFNKFCFKYERLLFCIC